MLNKTCTRSTLATSILPHPALVCPLPHRLIASYFRSALCRRISMLPYPSNRPLFQPLLGETRHFPPLDRFALSIVYFAIARTASARRSYSRARDDRRRKSHRRHGPPTLPGK